MSYVVFFFSFAIISLIQRELVALRLFLFYTSNTNSDFIYFIEGVLSWDNGC